MSQTRTLAQFIADTEYDNLPSAVVEAAKTAILDGVANVVAGSVQELADIIGRYVRDAGGSPQSSVVGWGYKTNPPAAAFANGVFGHCLDYEIQGFPPTHGTSSCLPAALALAELHHVPGSRVITAYVLGWEIQGRLRAASAPATAPGYHPPGLVGPLGGAAAAAKTVGLDADQTLMALGIAASRTGGLTANTGTMVKSTHPGNAARMGAEAAILAGMGYTASDEVLESPVGYAAAIFGGDFNWDVATGGLGSSWRLVDPGFDIKRFPAQVYMQNAIEAALNLREQNGVEPNDIERVTIRRQGRGHSGPVPRSGLDGKFSVEYCAPPPCWTDRWASTPSPTPAASLPIWRRCWAASRWSRKDRSRGQRWPPPCSRMAPPSAPSAPRSPGRRGIPCPGNSCWQRRATASVAACPKQTPSACWRCWRTWRASTMLGS